MNFFNATACMRKWCASSNWLRVWLGGVPMFLGAQPRIAKVVVAEPTAPVVVTEHPAATAVGVEILRQGGNAYDAAVAVHFALAVVMPRAGNLGGGGFAVLRRADGTAAALDFRETAPALAHERMFLDSAGRLRPGASLYSGLAVGVPGAVAGMWQLHQYGGRLPWKALVEPAAALADTGFFLTPYQARLWNEYREWWQRQNPDCPFPFGEVKFTAGQRIRQPRLATTLRRIAERGAAAFYRGPVARAVARTVHAHQGILTTQDLREYMPVWRPPLTDTLDSVAIITMPPPSAGGLALIQLMRILRTYPWDEWKWNGWPAVQRRVAAMAHVFAARLQYVGDPRDVQVPVRYLLSPRFADSVRTLIERRATTPLPAAEPSGRHTTHYSIVDSAGHAVSVTTTLNSNFGSGIYVCEAGFFLNNEMDDFSARPGALNQFGLMGSDINAVRPRRRPVSSMTPTIVVVNGRLRYILGTPGGTTIPTTVFNVLARVFFYGDDLAAAVAAPRLHHQGVPKTVFFERLPWPVRWKLRRRGLVPRKRSLGRVSAVGVEPSRRIGVGDPRSDNVAGR